MDLREIENIVTTYCDDVKRQKTLYEDRVKNLTGENKNLASNQSKLDLYSKTSDFLNRFSSLLREQISKEIEELVSKVIQRVLKTDRYSFKIYFQVKRSTTEAVFCLWDKQNKSNIDLIDSSGGGIADIVSTILFFAFLQIKDSKSNFLIFDEVGKNISADRREDFFILLKELIENYNKQIIYVTHQEELVEVSDNVIKMNLDDKGYVTVENNNV
jgi:DNA repair exonuclease SbcCD ATPase subunit